MTDNADGDVADGSASRSRSTAAGPELVDVIAVQSVEGGDSLYLEIYAEDLPAEVIDTIPESRGSQRSTLWSGFDLFGYKYLAAQGWDGNQTSNFAYKVVTSIKDDIVTTPKEYIWPGGRYKLKFFGVMPSDTGTPMASDAKGDPCFKYTVPLTQPSQRDIFVASSGEIAGNSYKPVKMNFTHALASVSFITNTDRLLYSGEKVPDHSMPE